MIVKNNIMSYIEEGPTEVRGDYGMEEVMEERAVMEERPIGSLLNELTPKKRNVIKQEVLREYEIKIRFLSVGCVVSVGCKEIPFRSVKEAMEKVNMYVNDPYEEGQKWRKIFETGE